LTSREEINTELRAVLDEATGKWGIRVNRVELKAMRPADSIKDSMEKQMRADRDKARLHPQREARSSRRSLPPRASGAPPPYCGPAARPRPRSCAPKPMPRPAAARARGQSEAITTVVKAIQDGNVDQRLFAYQYLQTLPQLAQAAQQVWSSQRVRQGPRGLGGNLTVSSAPPRPPPPQHYSNPFHRAPPGHGPQPGSHAA